jgi:V/A-type H+-transporting ATPase subunit I
MMFTTEMIQLFAVVLARDSERVSEVLLQEGVIQFINTTEIDNRDLARLSAVNPRASLKEITDLRERVGGLLRAGGIIPAAPRPADLNTRVPIEIEKEKNLFDRIDGERESIRERQRTLQQEILKLEDIRRQVDLYGLGLSELPLKTRHSFLQIQTGKVPESNIKKLEDGLRDLPSLNVAIGRENETAYYLLISMKRDSEQIRQVLSRAGWTNIELPNELMSVKKDVFRELSVKLDAFTTEQKQLEQKVVDLMTKHAEHLNQVWTNLRMTELLYKIQTYFKSSSRTVIFTGWLPASKREKLTEQIHTSCSGRCYLEWHEPGDKETLGDEVPVQFNNPKILAPFEMLVSNFGIPQYGTIDPTPFVMPLYLSMYGLMFADVGQGFILVLAGILGAFIFKSIPERRGWYTLSWLVIWCGFSSVIFGALFGSYFGTALFKPLWFDFHGIISGHHTNDSTVNDLFDILAITLYFGISVIFLGLLFNWINLIRTRKWFELFFDEVGIIGGWIYAAGIYSATYMLRHDYRQLPPAKSLFVLIVLPCLLLFLKEPYHYFVRTHRQAQPAAPGQQLKAQQFNPLILLMFLLQWIVEILDIFSRYLANTLSFMRVAGLGIAHVSLMISFFTIAGMTSGFFSVVILVLGNILVICLEGLTAGVQALRLSYYEFFTKFFRGTGKLYTPISLNSS